MGKLVLFFTVILACANSVAATVIDIKESNIEFAIDGSEQVSVGDSLSLPEKCSAKVTAISGRKVTGILESCEDISKIVPGTRTNSVEVTTDDQIKAQSISENNEVPVTQKKDSYFSVGVGLVFSPTIKMDYKYFSGTTELNGRAEFDMDSTISISGEWSQFKKHSWNNGAALSYMNMKFNKGTVSVGSQSSSGTMSDSKLSILTAAYAGKLRWDLFYLPVYAGLSNGLVDSKDQVLKTITTRVFVAAGAGYVINDILNLETTFNLHTTYSGGGTYTSSNSSSTYTLVPEVGSLTYLQVAIKAIF